MRVYNLTMATIKEISEKTGVSPSAVSRILNSDPSFSATTEVRLNVLKCAASLGYRTPRQKKDTSCNLTFGVADWHIIPEGQEPIYDLSFLGKLDGGHAISIRRLNRGEVVPLDGIIAFGIFTPEEMETLMLSTTNIVIINSEKSLDYSFNRIVIDFDIALENAVTYLSEMSGNIAFLGGIWKKDGITIGTHRADRVREILQSKGLYREELFFTGELAGEYGAEAVRRAAEKGATSLMIFSQLLEKGALEEYGKLGLDFPVVIYRDIPLDSEKTAFPVIRMYPVDVWEMAVRTLSSNLIKPKSAVNTYIPAVFEK